MHDNEVVEQVMHDYFTPETFKSVYWLHLNFCRRNLESKSCENNEAALKLPYNNPWLFNSYGKLALFNVKCVRVKQSR